MTDFLPSLAIIVVNYGSHALLKKNLVAVAGHTTAARIVVVDSYSSAEERRAVEELTVEFGWDLLTPDTNVGFGRGANIGVQYACSLGAECFLLLNPDAVLDRESLNTLWKFVANRPLTLASPTVLRPDGSVWFNGADLYLDTGLTAARSRRSMSEVRRTEPWLSGACLMVSRELWELVDGFDEEYFLYWEDIDISHRIRQAGGELAVLHNACAVHDEGGTQRRGKQAPGSNAKSSTYYYFNIRNRLLYGARHLDNSDLARWTATTLWASCEILLRGGRRQFIRPKAPVSAALLGIRDGLRAAAKERRRRARHERGRGWLADNQR